DQGGHALVQLEGVAQARAGALDDNVGRTEGAPGDDRAEEGGQLHPPRPIEAHEAASGLEVLGRAGLAAHLQSGVDRREIEDREGEADDEQEHGEAAGDALQGGDHARCPRGSRASRRVWPSVLNEKVTRNSAAAGKRRKAGATSSQEIASPIERPQEGVGGSTPTPRKDRAASALIRPGSEMQE